MSTKNIFLKLTFGLLVSAAVFQACEDPNELVIPPAQATFAGRTSATLTVTSTNSTAKIPVSITNVASSDRTLNLNVTSRTGAVRGTHYNVPTSIVIPAGKAVDTLLFQAVPSFYIGTTRRDTLDFTFQNSEGVDTANFNNKYTLVVRG